MEDLNVTYLEDTQQVRALKYLPESEQQWKGLVATPLGHKETTTMLDEEWVNQNFTSSFIAAVKENANHGKKFLKIPPGSAFDSDYLETVPAECVIPNGPPLKFCSAPGLDACLGASMASALNYLGYTAEAQSLDDLGIASIDLSSTCPIPANDDRDHKGSPQRQIPTSSNQESPGLLVEDGYNSRGLWFSSDASGSAEGHGW